MPRPCAVESHARSYKYVRMGLADATALCRGESRSQLQNTSELVLRCHGLVPWRVTRGYKIRQDGFSGCHGLVPWRVTLAATKDVRMGLADATALRRGESRSQLQKMSEWV